MRVNGWIALIFCCLVLPAALAFNLQGNQEKSPCSDRVTTQTELTDCSGEEFRLADAELNSTYRQLLRQYADDKQFIEKLRTAQRTWLAYREAHVDSVFPRSDKSEYGSVYVMCRSRVMTELTKERNEILKEMLKDHEGDVCGRYAGKSPGSS